MFLVTEVVLINFSPVFKRLEGGVCLGPRLLKCFRLLILYHQKKKCFVMKQFVLNIAILKNDF